MNPKHTQGRLLVASNTVYSEGEDIEMGQLLYANGRDLIWWSSGNGACIENLEDARRLAACWNACIGWSTEYLEHPDNPGFMARMNQVASGQAMILAQAQEVITERDQLRSALAQKDRVIRLCENDLQMALDECARLKQRLNAKAKP